MNYTSFQQIEKDLTILQLKRKIAVEEIKALKNITSSQLSVSSFITSPLLQLAGKYGLSVLINKILKKF
ncbi:hypothetical protein [Aquimarina agarilytica]|uniref:hypothetical protein n=1 Tax=Aquimarina agarilytica TaxID=1087449 RepID=UPI000288AA6C|nr:hypothetical protein [Aquimarina agarilytica]